MTTSSFSCAHLTDKDLLSEVVRLAGIERHATAQLIASLAELDARRLYLGEGCSSLFTYCTQILHLSEHAAYGRIEAARAARRFPVILEMLAAGEVTVTTVRLLSSMLTTENHRKVLAEAAHKSKREVEEIAARLRPRPDVPSAVRKLPEPRTTIPAPLVAAQLPSASPGWVSATVAPDLPSSATRPAVKPLAPERYKIQFTVGRETHEKLRRVQNLLRHSLPDGDPAVVFDRALTVLLAQLEKEKLAATSRPREGRAFTSSSRHIPAVVKRAVWKRDGGQCAFRGKRGRCTERGLLEFHHVSPYAAGGAAVEENIELRCAAHNQYEADLFFGSPPLLLVRERSSAPCGANGPDRVDVRVRAAGAFRRRPEDRAGVVASAPGAFAGRALGMCASEFGGDAFAGERANSVRTELEACFMPHERSWNSGLRREPAGSDRQNPAPARDLQPRSFPDADECRTHASRADHAIHRACSEQRWRRRSARRRSSHRRQAV